MSEISDLIEKISKLPLETSRKISAFIGAIVGDAACIHLEWIYDEVTLAEKGVIYFIIFTYLLFLQGLNPNNKT